MAKITTDELQAEWRRQLQAELAAQQPPKAWGGYMTASQIAEARGVPAGGAFFYRLRACVESGKIRSGKCRANGGRLRTYYSLRDVVKAAKEGLI